jgi:nucleotide-binding universal stress UspA family protein
MANPPAGFALGQSRYRGEPALSAFPETKRAAPSMTYASIMVSVDLAGGARGRIRIAARLADAFDGRTIGVAAQSPNHVAAQVGPMGASSLLPGLSRQAVLDGLDRAHDLFREAVGSRSRVSWRSTPKPGLAYLTSQARAADLIVVGQGNGSEATGCIHPLNPASVVLAAGRPVLVVPPGIDHLEARRVMVAWKDTREARRAVSDALPILRLARRVDIVSVTGADQTYGAADVAAYLSTHGIHATSSEHRSEGAGDADTLLYLASEHASDLIVMGAYGHGRVREMVLGGVTRDVLRHSPTCSLLSH